MESKCVIVELNSSLQGLFEQLDELGAEYVTRPSVFLGNLELMCVVEHEKMHELEDILAPYV